MTAKEYCQSINPLFRSESHTTNRGDKYWLIRERGNTMYFSEGKTESNAWVNAKNKLKEQRYDD